MSSQSTYRELQREERRQQREAVRRQKELERQAKEQAKLSAIEQAQLEVGTYENQLELLVSVHKEQGPAWDWAAVAAALPPAAPRRLVYHELRVRQQACISALSKQPPPPDLVSQAQLLDDREYVEALASHEAELANHQRLKSLARRILTGDLKAYTEAFTELSPLTELSVLGSKLHFTVHDISLAECVLNVAGPSIVPAETKSLTATGKVSVKPMPRTRLHELYQDHICSCVLRVAKETFALLPVDTLLITAAAKGTDASSRHRAEQPVLSVVFPRSRFLELDFDSLDPSDAVETFRHRGDFKASRKTAAFAPILPLTIADVARPSATKSADIADLLEQAQALRKEFKADLAKVIAPLLSPEISESQPSWSSPP